MNRQNIQNIKRSIKNTLKFYDLLSHFIVKCRIRIPAQKGQNNIVFHTHRQYFLAITPDHE